MITFVHYPLIIFQNLQNHIHILVILEPIKANNLIMHIAIAGNIGSGKTTLAGLLAKHYGWIPITRMLMTTPT